MSYAIENGHLFKNKIRILKMLVVGALLKLLVGVFMKVASYTILNSTFNVLDTKCKHDTNCKLCI